MSATDYAQVLAADTAANEVYASTVTEFGTRDLECRRMCRMLRDLDCMIGAGIYAANDYEARLVTVNCVREVF